MASDAIEKFIQIRKQYSDALGDSNQGSKKKYASEKELDFCRKSGLGFYTGVFLTDKDDNPYRYIFDYRSFRLSREKAQELGLRDYELRVCRPSEYKAATDSQREVIAEVVSYLAQLSELWDKCPDVQSVTGAKYGPSYAKNLMIMYMKVTKKQDAKGAKDDNFVPGVKVLMSRSPNFGRQFEAFIENYKNAYGGYEAFLPNFIDRNTQKRTQCISLSVARPQFYSFTINSIPMATEITNEDLEDASHIEEEVVDVKNAPDMETLNIWKNHLKSCVEKLTRAAVKDSPVQTETVAAQIEQEKAGVVVEEVPQTSESEISPDPFTD